MNIKGIIAKFPKSLGVRLAIIGGPVIVLLLVVAFAVDLLGVKYYLFGRDQSAQTDIVTGEEVDSLAVQTEQLGEIQRRSRQLEKEELVLALQRAALDAEKQDINWKIAQFQREKEEIEKGREDIKRLQASLESEVTIIDRRWKSLDELEQELIQREKFVLNWEQEQESNKPVALPEKEPEAARDQRFRRLAKGFSTMRPKEVANLLLKMLDRGDEGEANVLKILQSTDNDTRMRIMSAIAKIEVDTAAELTQTLIAR